MEFSEFVKCLNDTIHEQNEKGLHSFVTLDANVEDRPETRDKLIEYYHDLGFGIDVYRCKKGTYDITIWW